ncbi:MAG TPA: NAD(P)/FAD-dependent oxidoreductase [Chloroflexota bacterium]|nr:NAD(P)/FAD-dependent oxidoreductase [Chloroflexota bacterium]
MKAIVVGAGLAGLVAARTLRRAGWEVVVIEASDGIGGRVRTDVVEEFKLDRGFQTLFTAYPAVQRQLDVKALRPRPFDAGVVLAEGGRWNELGDPFKDIKSLGPTALSSLATVRDKRLLLRLRRQVRREGADHIFRGPDQETQHFLKDYGFSQAFVELFFRGLFGGMFMDRELTVSSRSFLFNLKMLVEGRVVLPRDGMQAIPNQLASDLTEVRLETPALRLELDGAAVKGVRTASDDVEADVVVLAAHAPEVERLAGLPMPKEAHSATCLYFHLPHPVYGHKKIVLNGYRDAFVQFAVQVTNVSASYAPQPEHLLCATILGAPDLSQEELTDRALADMQRWFPWRQIAGLRVLAAYQLPFAQLAQPPGFHEHLPANRTGTKGLYLAGEFTEGSSMNGALVSGEKAAAAILSDYELR